MNIEYLKVKDIKPYDRNAKKHDETQIKNVVESIKQFGFAQPLVVDKNNELIIGHCRLIAAKRLKMDEVPVLVMDNLSNGQVEKLRLLDNKLNESEWDFDLLAEDVPLLDFSDFDIDWGIDDILTEEDLEIEEDEVPETAPAISKNGDLWHLGGHRLLCGDSTNKEQILKLMDGKKADMVFTDPPYGVSASGGRRQTAKKRNMKAIKNDELRNNDLTQFLTAFISAMEYKPTASIYICYPWATQKEFTQAIQNNNLKIKNCIIWDKKSFGLNGFKGYRPQYEMIYFCCKEDFEWYGDLSQSNIWQVSREIDRENQGNHPTPKPLELIKIAIKNSSRENEIVLDVFGGSGSTLIACEKTNRICYMCELDPGYIDTIIQRYINLGNIDINNIWVERDGKRINYVDIIK